MGGTKEAERISFSQLRRDLAEFTYETFVMNHAEVVALVEAVEAARQAENWLVVPSDVPAQHYERLGVARAELARALARFDWEAE